MLFVELVNQDFKTKSQQQQKNFSDNIDRQIVSSNYKTCISIVKTVKSIKHVSKKIRPDFKE